jgi:hypothetical protein
VAAGHDFSRYDTDGSGRIERDELHILLFGAARFTGEPGLEDIGGSTREIDDMPLPGVVLETRRVGAMSEHTSLATVTHELMHQMGTAQDLYGACGPNERASLMGATIAHGPDVRETWDLDPWHKMRVGWLEPEVFSLADTPEGSAWLLESSAATDRPIILYHPDRYDLSRKYGEYFLIEHRTRKGYDADGRGEGVAVWHVKNGSRGALHAVPGRVGCGEMGPALVYVGVDNSLHNPTLLQLQPHRGNGDFIRQRHGIVPLRWYDGRDSGVRIQVTDPPAGSSGYRQVAWSSE